MKRTRNITLLVALLALAFPVLVMAGGAGNDEFTEIYEWAKGITQGSLGRLVALLFVVIGVIAGVARGSIFGFVLGVAAAIGFYFAPDIIEGLMGASLPALH